MMKIMVKTNGNKRESERETGKGNASDHNMENAGRWTLRDKSSVFLFAIDQDLSRMPPISLGLGEEGLPPLPPSPPPTNKKKTGKTKKTKTGGGRGEPKPQQVSSLEKGGKGLLPSSSPNSHHPPFSIFCILFLYFSFFL